MKAVVKKKVGKYEVGRTIGEGTFAKVKFAQNTETGESVAIKVMAKSTILKHKMVDQVFHMLFSVVIVLIRRMELAADASTFDFCVPCIPWA